MDVNSIAAAAAAQYEAKMLEARSASSIDEALAKQKEGFTNAMKAMLNMLMAQAVVTGICPPNGGALTAGKIT